MTVALANPAPLAGATTATASRQATVRPAPRREPPFDDELDPRTTPAAFDRELPFDEPSRRPAPVLHRVLDEGLPEPAQWSRRLLIGLTEAAGGKRPLHQLLPHLTPSIAEGLSAELSRSQPPGRRHWLHGAVPRTVRAMQPRAGVAEINATMRVGERVRAIALRIERHHDRWRCTRMQLG